VLLVLGVVAWASYRSVTATLDSTRWVAHTREVLETLDGLVAQVARAEAAYRDFLASGDDRSLQSLDSAFQAVPSSLERLRALTADNPSQAQLADALVPLLARRLVWSQQVVDTRRARGPEAAQRALRAVPQQALTVEIQRVVDAMKGAEEVLLEQRTAALNDLARRTKLMILVGGVLAVVVAVAAAVQVNRELAARQRAERALRESEERFEALLDAVKDYAILWLDASGRVASWNASAERLKGYRAEEIVGKHLSVFYTPEDRAAGKPEAMLTTAAADGRAEDEGWRVRRDGSRFWANVVLTALRDAGGQLRGFGKITRDMTERRRRDEELRRYAAQLEAANAELDTFAYSVSHDLRAPLRSIDGFSQALLEDYGNQLDAGAHGHLDRVRAATQRMATLIDDLLSLSRVTRVEFRREAVDASALATSIAADLRRAEPERRVEVAIAPGLVADADPHLLRIVLENLLGNAWKYTGKSERPRIEFGTGPQNGTTAYYVRDNGAGFDMAYANKLFGAFQRLHSSAEFEGTGIGLATVQRIVHRHGGRAWAEGAVGRGATFYFTL
jgi:PAS domain S-box-containing protein